MEKIGIVGAGLIGSSWSAIFSSKGFNVVIYANQLLRSAYPAMYKTAKSILENKRVTTFLLYNGTYIEG